MTTPNLRLKRFLHELTPEKQKLFARLAGTSVGALRHLVTGRRTASAAMGIALEKAAAEVAAKVGEDVSLRLTRADLVPACRGCEYNRACTGKGRLD